MAAIPEIREVDEVPDSLKKLASIIIRGFYTLEHSIIMETLKREVCCKEDRLRELTKLDQKQLRALLMNLRNEKLIKERQETEKRDSDGRSFKTNYYFVNYRAVLNVTKYKIDHMRKKLESQDQVNARRASYKCSTCQKTYGDEDMNNIMDFVTGVMSCIFCQGDVHEDETVVKNESSRSCLAAFNEALLPIFNLLRELDGIQLKADLSEPPLPQNIPSSLSNGTNDRPQYAALGGSKQSTGSNRPQFELYQQQQGLTVDIIDPNAIANVPKASAGGRVPTWLQDHSNPATTSSLTVSTTSLASPNTQNTPMSPDLNHDLVKTLLTHEQHTESGTDKKDDQPTSVSTETATTATATIGGKEVDEDSDLEDVEEHDEQVFVQGVAHLLVDVMQKPDLVQKMNELEKEAYVNASQALMSHME